MRTIVRQLGRLGRHVHTLTSDNGKEFSEHQLIACALKADFYFADPYCAWQCGGNEKANGLVRQHLPHKLDVSTLSDDTPPWIEQRIYHRPRKVLGFKKPLEVFSEDSLITVANQI